MAKGKNFETQCVFVGANIVRPISCLHVNCLFRSPVHLVIKLLSVQVKNTFFVIYSKNQDKLCLLCELTYMLFCNIIKV